MTFTRRIIGKTLDLLNLQRHNDNYADIENDLTNHDSRITGAQSDITTHKASTAAHPAEHVTYEGAIVGAANIKEGLDIVKTELNQAIISGDSGPEARAARASISGETYETLGDRLNDEYVKHSAQLADIALNVTSYGAVTGGGLDDTAAWQAAIDAAYALGGGTVSGPPNVVYGIAGTIRTKTNVTLDFKDATLKRIGSDITSKIIQNDNYASSSVIDTNITIKNVTIEGTGAEMGVSDQGAGIGIYSANRVTLENIKTKNTNGDGIQWRKADNLTIRNVNIGTFGRNGISPTSGLNSVWDNFIVSGSPLPGANPGKDIDAETNSATERGTHFANNIVCKNISLVDFYSADGADFSQEWMFNNCKIGPGFSALQIKSTNKTIARNIIVPSNCLITAAGSNGAAVLIENVSGVKLSSPVIKAGGATGQPVGVSIVGTVDSLDISNVDLSSFYYGIRALSAARLNNSRIKNANLGRLYLGGSNNVISNVDITALTINGVDSVSNVFDIGTKINTVVSVDSGAITSQIFGSDRGNRSKAIYSSEVKVPNGTTYDMVLQLPTAVGATNGRSFLIFAGYSYLGRADHSASLLVVITTGDTTNAVAKVIDKSGTKDISVTAVTSTSVTLTLTYQFAGNFTAMVIG